MRISYKFGAAIGHLDNLPGCSQVGVSHGSFVQPSERGKGVGSMAHQARLRMAEGQLGYDCLLCTVDMKNTAELAIIAKNGWRRATVFMSSNSGNEIGLFYINFSKTKFDDLPTELEIETYKRWEDSLARAAIEGE